jgi:hypothetical protein
MSERRSGVTSPPTPGEPAHDDDTRAVDEEPIVDDEELISSASEKRREGGQDADLVTELLERAAKKNRAALDRSAR